MRKTRGEKQKNILRCRFLLLLHLVRVQLRVQLLLGHRLSLGRLGSPAALTAATALAAATTRAAAAAAAAATPRARRLSHNLGDNLLAGPTRVTPFASSCLLHLVFINLRDLNKGCIYTSLFFTGIEGER